MKGRVSSVGVFSGGRCSVVYGRYSLDIWGMRLPVFLRNS